LRGKASVLSQAIGCFSGFSRHGYATESEAKAKTADVQSPLFNFDKRLVVFPTSKQLVEAATAVRYDFSIDQLALSAPLHLAH